jgi:transposase-like protein
MAKRKDYTPEYKAKLVIEILREEHTISEIASREGINVKRLGNWKSEFLENADARFQPEQGRKDGRSAGDGHTDK